MNWKVKDVMYVNDVDNVNPKSSGDVSKVDRFDLEQDIMECWNIIEDLRNIDSVGDKDKYIVTISDYYETKFSKMFDTLETLVHEGKL